MPTRERADRHQLWRLRIGARSERNAAPSRLALRQVAPKAIRIRAEKFGCLCGYLLHDHD
jgi:hypothetical protein